MENTKNIAVLIDADNAQLSKMEALFLELSTYGRIVVKKAYGNWKKSTLKKWETEVKRLAIKTEQQFDYVSGKNTTDIAMVIDAMDLLHAKMYDTFALVSSDSDFTPLAIRLRESGAYIIGAGESKTPEAFRNACDDFILVDYIAREDKKKTAPAVSDKAITPKPPKEPEAAPSGIEEIHNLLTIASDKYQDADGFVNIASAGQYLKRAKPDFTPLTYGFSKLPELIGAFPERYKMKRTKGKGTAIIVSYRCNDMG